MPERRKIIDVSQAAKMLSVSRQTIVRMFNAQRIDGYTLPHTIRKRTIRIYRDSIQDILDNNPPKTYPKRYHQLNLFPTK